MLRRGFVLLGLAVLLSLLFPLKALLKDAGVDPQAWSWPALDLAAACALLALLPAYLLCRDSRLAQRIPRWSVWVVLLALCSLLFLALHVSWSLALATAYVGPAVDEVELATRLGVLVSLVGVLLNLDAAPEDGELPVKRKRK